MASNALAHVEVASTREPASRRDRFCIIGAGPAGLGVARSMKERGLMFDVLERHSAVGGIWDLSNPGTPMYESAHFISSRRLSGYEDFHFPDSVTDYPSREEVLAFIRAYAEHYQLERHVQFGSNVLALEPRRSGGWLVSLADGSRSVYGGVVLANGCQWVPNLPEYPGMRTFRGSSFHSIAHRAAGEFEGKRVLIVGCGASAVDIANDAAPRARTVVMSVRRGHYFIPKHMFGVPTDVWARSGPALPAFARQFMLRHLLRWLHGDPTRYGFPAPDHEILERPPILNSQIFEHLSHGRLRAKPDLAQIDAHGVTFKDGSYERFDTIVFCTGYLECWPFLDPRHLRPTGDGDLFLQLFHKRFDDLFVAGLLRTNAGGFAMYERQGALIARAAQASPQETEQLKRLKNAATRKRAGAIRYQKNEYQSKYLDEQAYQQELRALARSMGW